MANVITGIRIVCALSLIFCPTFSAWFYTLYIIGEVSDVLDGIAARHSGKETKFGAQLDTIADIVFTIVVIINVVRAISVPMWLIIWTVCIAAIKCFSIFMGFVIRKRFVPEHTVMNRICGAILFAIPLCVGWLPQQQGVILMILTCCAATIATVQEGYYVCSGKEIS